MSEPGGARLALAHVGLGSCLKAGIVAGLGVGLVVLIGAFTLWEIVVPGIVQTVGSGFAGSRALLGSLLGAGTGFAVAAVLAALAALVVVAVSVLAPLFYDLVARRTPGVGVILAPDAG